MAAVVVVVARRSGSALLFFLLLFATPRPSTLAPLRRDEGLKAAPAVAVAVAVVRVLAIMFDATVSQTTHCSLSLKCACS